MRLATVQNYINKLLNRGEINEGQKKLMRPQTAQFGKGYGLPKTDMTFQPLPEF